MDFDDSRLAETTVSPRADEALRHLAGAGARIRREAGAPAEQLAGGFEAGRRPRGVVAIGRGARLIRAVLEPFCPAPFVAWPFPGLPAWVGALDLVVVLAAEGSEPALMSAVHEAVRRGCAVVVAARPGSPMAEAAAGSSTLHVPVETADELAAVVQVLSVLHHLGLGPFVDPQVVAEAADAVANVSSPHRDLAINPAKDFALHLADAQPLVFGGTVLAARAGRRLAEALRRASGRAALAADLTELEPIITAIDGRDVFADPFDDPGSSLRPVLVVLDDGTDDPGARRQTGELVSLAGRHEVTVVTLVAGDPGVSPMDRYASLLYQGLFGATWLQVGLGRL
ncbi:SIS domain-containing protein [Propionibacteriaceae bacterium G1746]|uniref:SIS domain-containing protein n=1 Tax=Aestuariimicrobium sp. G57 TaxID=3418485 RepID=UPI003C21F2AF